jgi:alpha-beta hydrolase superfamily lysophospholipase
MMKVNNYQINAGKGCKLYCRYWQANNKPRAVLFIVHGLGEHSGRYEEFAGVLAKNDIATFIFDHRGHGQSEGKRGQAQSIEQLLEDTEFALMKCRSLFLEIPLFMMGHSMGGQVAATFIKKAKSKEISGAIISSGWFRLHNPPPKWLWQLVHFLKKIAPRFRLSNGLDAIHISSVKEEVEMYQHDNLIHDKISLALSYTLFFNGIEIINKKSEVRIPVLVCHGDQDKITSMEASKDLAQNLGDVAEFISWPGSFHEPHHDHDKEKVMQFYADWILKNCAK